MSGILLPDIRDLGLLVEAWMLTFSTTWVACGSCDWPAFAVAFDWCLSFVSCLPRSEVINGVGAEGVKVKFPLFPVSCSRLPLSTKKSPPKNEQRKMQKSKENYKKELSSNPIYADPIKNLPTHGEG